MLVHLSQKMVYGSKASCRRAKRSDIYIYESGALVTEIRGACLVVSKVIVGNRFELQFWETCTIHRTSDVTKMQFSERC